MEEPKLTETRDEYTYEELDGNIEKCLTVIIEKLKKGQMSVMIGAGFSKNANPAYPSWPQLMISAYKELYPDKYELHATKIREKIEKNSGLEIDQDKEQPVKIIEEIQEELKQVISNAITNPSGFAQKYIDMKGRREDLDIYIEDALVPIESSETNSLELHEKLLSLNWNDIITTNWDTLLERANSNGYYEVVKSAKRLKVRNRRRIIKINGSLRSDEEKRQRKYSFDDSFNYLYVITEDDFNNYHIEHPDFSNFMKVKMLQDAFCLIGFSGNDPNFRYWIKELKRTMTKGGNTEEPNPIFFIDTSTGYPDPATLQYYKNNYIVRISLDESVKYIKGSLNKIETMISDLSMQEIENKISEKFLILFKYMQNVNSSSEKSPVINQNKYNNILKVIAYKDINISTDINDTTAINTLPVFYFNNLYYSEYIITYMRNTLRDTDAWTENEYLAVYNLCVSNYYTISNIYEPNILKKITENYNKKILPEKKVFSFLQQILKSDRHNDEQNTKLNNYSKSLSKIDEYKNMLTYEKALRLYEDFEYEELQSLLNEWKPENDKHVDALSVLKKLRLVLAFDNIMFLQSKKEDVKNLLDAAEKAALEDADKQILLFIKDCRRRILSIIDYLEPNDIINKEISELIAQGYKLSDEYIKELLAKPSNNSLKPNEDVRYSRTLIQYPDPKKTFPAVFRIFNFIEYTGIPAYFCLEKTQLLKLVQDNKDNQYCLFQLFLKSIPFFGNSASEDTLRTIVPSILRYMEIKMLTFLYDGVFKIIKYKIDKIINPTVYVYIMTEIIKRIPQSEYTDYISYIIRKIEEKNNIVISCIIRGEMWGWKKPFFEILKRIDSFADYKKILIWIMEEFLKDCKELSRSNSYGYEQSEFFSYYIALITDSKFTDEKKEFFASEKGKQLIDEDMQYTKKLALYAYDYMKEGIQKELIAYFEEHYTIRIDPYFITKLKTDKLKNRCLNLIKEYDVQVYSSLDYSLLHLVKALNTSQLLNDEDKKTICRYIADKYKILQKNIDYFKHDPYMHYTNLQNEFFLIIAEILTKKQLQKDIEFNKIYTELEKIYKAEKSESLEFKWLYTDDLQKFKQYFLETLSCFSYLHLEKQYLPIINICLSKIIVQNSAEFEAVLEQFINVYKGKYGDGVFENETTTGILIQILTKFRIEIPFCYDDLFIKAQMQRLAKYMEAVNIKDEVIDYWLNEDISTSQ
ncbi:SIR2 family protein [Treponema vincentii]|uniref:SIR2 family protein n=1 Tax=Treponema vincentii TaxID=69710 RepID=UPI003D8DBC09